MCALLMLRKLLACLALLTGLAAAGAPAQAEVAVAMASRIEASAAVHAVVPRQVASRPARAVRAYRAADRALETIADVSSSFPTVYIGSDRSRE